MLPNSHHLRELRPLTARKLRIRSYPDAPLRFESTDWIIGQRLITLFGPCGDLWPTNTTAYVVPLTYSPRAPRLVPLYFGVTTTLAVLHYLLMFQLERTYPIRLRVAGV